MAKYHINNNGDAGRCEAKTEGGCPFGGPENHFTSMKGAREAAESRIEAEKLLESVAPAIEKYGENSAVFRSWKDIHSDFKTNTDGKRSVLVNSSGGATLVPWYGPKLLEQFNAARKPSHGLTVRVITEDGELVSEDSDFSEDAKWDWFDETRRTADAGTVVQLIDSEGNVVGEERV